MRCSFLRMAPSHHQAPDTPKGGDQRNARSFVVQSHLVFLVHAALAYTGHRVHSRTRPGDFRVPVQSARKFSQVMGQRSDRSSIRIRPAMCDPIWISKKTMGFSSRFPTSMGGLLRFVIGRTTHSEASAATNRRRSSSRSYPGRQYTEQIETRLTRTASIIFCIQCHVHIKLNSSTTEYT